MIIYYTPESRDDLQRIKESVLEKFGSIELAENVLRQIIKGINNLKVFPNMGVVLNKVMPTVSSYRVLVCERNYVFYRVEDNVVRIIRVLNEKQDYMGILFGISDEK